MVAKSVFKPFEDDNPAASAENGSVCILVEGAAMPVGRLHPPGLVKVTVPLGDLYGCSPGNDHIALVVHQAVNPRYHGNQGSGTCALDINAGTGQVQLI